MRILQIIPSLDIGGAEKVVEILSRKLAASGNDVSILTENYLSYPSRLPSIGYLSVSSKLNQNRLVKILKLLAWPIRQHKILADFQIIHCHLTRGMLIGLVITFLPIRSRPQVVATCQSVGGNISGARILLEKICARRFDAFVLMAMTRDWNQLSRNNSKITFIPNGIDPIQNVAKLNVNDANEFVVGTLSRLTEDRKPWLFIRLFKKLQDINPGIKFIIGGDGPLKSDLILMAKKEELANIFWVGQVDDKPVFLVN